MANQTKATKRSFKDVTLAYLMQGIPGVQNEIAQGASEDVVLAGLNHLQSEGADVGELRSFCVEQYDCEFAPSTTESRGRGLIQSGESRTLKVQHPESQKDPFLRLNMRAMGLDLGDEVVATLNEDGSMTLREV